MFNGGVREFAGIPQRELVGDGISIGDRKANGIPIAIRRQMGTGCCVSEIAEFPNVGVGRGYVRTRGTATSSPSRSERETRGMQPGAVVHDLQWHKKRTGQIGFPGEQSL